jgi:hypothetical protein
MALCSLGLPSDVVIRSLVEEIGLDHYDAVLATCVAIPKARGGTRVTTASIASDGRVFRR